MRKKDAHDLGATLTYARHDAARRLADITWRPADPCPRCGGHLTAFRDDTSYDVSRPVVACDRCDYAASAADHRETAHNARHPR